MPIFQIRKTILSAWKEHFYIYLSKNHLKFNIYKSKEKKKKKKKTKKTPPQIPECKSKYWNYLFKKKKTVSI